jgi:polysaccharide export outer membrane protein
MVEARLDRKTRQGTFFQGSDRSRVMDRSNSKDRERRVARWIPLIATAALWACGCQTVRTPEEKIAASGMPREKQMTSFPPYVIEPPDVLNIELLMGLPERPLSGEFLVRPDGTVNLGYYGEVYITGLTLREAKEKILLHLRKYLSDFSLGLVKEDPETGEAIEIDPGESNYLMIDVLEYNSKVYYVQGDVSVPGRMPSQGNETVLDAINNAGGLIPTSAPQNIRLVRPAPPGQCCEQVLPVNLPAIVNQGDTTTNYQIMPGDRIVVFRDPIVRTTLFLDRLASPFFTVVNGIQYYTFAYRGIKFININPLGIFGNQTSTSTTTPRTFPPITPTSR